MADYSRGAVKVLRHATANVLVNVIGNIPVSQVYDVSIGAEEWRSC